MALYGGGVGWENYLIEWVATDFHAMHPARVRAVYYEVYPPLEDTPNSL